MKVHTRIVFDMSTMDVLEDEWYEYDGPVSECKGGGSKTQQVIQKNDPPAYAIPHYQRIANLAYEQFQSDGPKYYPGSTVVGFSPETISALEMQTRRAMMGSPVIDAAKNQLTSTLRGDYLYGGRGFNAAVDAAARQITPMIDSKFGASGRFGGGLHKQTLGTAIADQFADQYARERTNQMRGMMFAPSMAQQDYFDINQLAQVGGAKEALAQEQLASDINRWNYEQNLPQQKLANYLALVGGSAPGGVSTSQQPIYRNRTAGLLGGAMAGAKLGAELGSVVPGIGTAIGTIGGGLLGGILGGM